MLLSFQCVFLENNFEVFYNTSYREVQKMYRGKDKNYYLKYVQNYENFGKRRKLSNEGIFTILMM